MTANGAFSAFADRPGRFRQNLRTPDFTARKPYRGFAAASTKPPSPLAMRFDAEHQHQIKEHP
ncbi:MAG: hypothetical protein IKM48_01580, partial [Clostridia bacterium]|nr:hypothetical protein [Clostridia bacterium]